MAEYDQVQKMDSRHLSVLVYFLCSGFHVGDNDILLFYPRGQLKFRKHSLI